MIILTADVHNTLPKAKAQKMVDKSEIELASVYAQFCLERGVKVTFFCAGKSLAETNADLSFLSQKGIEVGGHTWASFSPSWPHRISRFMCGRYSGFRALQRYQIQKTKKVIEDVVGSPMTSWRGHGYIGDDITYELLSESGVEVISDAVGPGLSVSTVNGMISLPINVIPDFEYLKLTATGRFNPTAEKAEAHGFRRIVRNILPEDVSRLHKPESFSDFPLDNEHWFDRVCEQVDKNEEIKIPSVVLMHPTAMQAMGGMSIFKRFLSYIESQHYETETMTTYARMLAVKHDDFK